jgi:ABC-type transporter Mla MlaB component
VATGNVRITIHGPLTRAGLPVLTRRCRALFAAHPGCRIDCDVSGTAADAVTIDALAKLQLIARENECVVVLRSAGPELRALVRLVGLTDVLPEAPAP